MPPKKRPGERWLKLAPFEIVEEYETPTDDSYVPKEDLLVAWSFFVVKAAQFKILFVLKVGSEESFTWAIVTGWEVSSIQALGGHVVIILENSSQQSAHVFMQDLVQPFDLAYLKEQCAEPELYQTRGHLCRWGHFNHQDCHEVHKAEAGNQRDQQGGAKQVEICCRDEAQSNCRRGRRVVKTSNSEKAPSGTR
jgi:hypothetical protein